MKKGECACVDDDAAMCFKLRYLETNADPNVKDDCLAEEICECPCHGDSEDIEDEAN